MTRLPLFVLLTGLVAAAFAQQERALVPVEPAAGPLKGPPVYATSHALLIGINDYPNLPPRHQLK